MDVNELAFSLLSVGDLLREANRQVNSDRTEISIRVRSDFKRGSFEVAMLIDQSVLQHAKDVLFPGAVMITGVALLKLLFGAEIEKAGIVPSLLEVWKKLKGEKPKETIKDDAKAVTIIVVGNENRVRVDPAVAELYANEELRKSLTGIVRPLVSPGIDSLTIRERNKNLNLVDKSDMPNPQSESELGDKVAGTLRSSTREAILRVSRANFEKGKWGFNDGAANFSADITDQAFLRRLDSREEGFYKGDTIRAIVTVTQVVSLDGSKFQTKYMVEKILEHVHAPKQQDLLSPPDSPLTY